jgi:serine/threonine-protein kinase HipA
MTQPVDLSALRDVDTADVYKAGRLAGRLHRQDDDVVFTYDDDYRKDPSVPPVAFTLPKDGPEVRATGGAAPAYFAGLLPEGLRLTAVVGAAGTSADDHLTLLLATGRDTIGDVQVLPTGEHLGEPSQALVESGVQEEDLAEVFARVTSTESALVDRVTLPGVQVKVSAQMVSTPLVTASGPAILKLSPPQDPQLVENEHFFMGMAETCGIPVPERRLVHDRKGRSGLLVARFDRAPANGRVRMLPQEDACQVLGRYPAAKYRLKFEDAVLALAEAVEAQGGSRPLAVRRLVELAAFSYLVGNGDLHGKNLSIRRSPSGLWEVTPTYDLLSTQPYLGWRDPMALRLYGRDNRLALRWWLEAAPRLGIPERAVRRSIGRIVEATEPYLGRLTEIGFDEPTTSRLHSLIAARMRELWSGDSQR